MMRPSFCISPEKKEQNTQVDMCFCIFRLQFQSTAKGRFGFGQSPGLLEQGAQVDMGFYIIFKLPQLGRAWLYPLVLGFFNGIECLRTVGRESPMSRAIAVIVCFCTECRLRIS